VSVLLRVVLDQLITQTDPDLATASRELTHALVQAAPSGCEVGALVPSGAHELDLPGVAEVRRLGMGRRELAAAWQLGVTAGTGGGLIHSPTLLAPLGRHDRVNDHDQTVVTLWDLLPWEQPEELPRPAQMWFKAMLKRARKHADAVVVPTHAMAQRLAEIVDVGGRVRVIAGAAPAGFAVPVDAVGRRRTLSVPEGVIVLVGDAAPSAALQTGFRAIAGSGADLPIVVVDAREGQEPAIVEYAEAAGIPARRVHVRVDLVKARGVEQFDDEHVPASMDRNARRSQRPAWWPCRQFQTTSALVWDCTGSDLSLSDPSSTGCRLSSSAPSAACTDRGRCRWRPTCTSRFHPS